MLNVCEIESSINGEINGFHQGSPAIFIRFQGCNFDTPCSYCDTTRAFKNTTRQTLTPSEVMYMAHAKREKEKIVVLTGGEPLFQDAESLFDLLLILQREGYKVVIETNGTLNPAPIIQEFPDVNIVMDFKLPCSGKFEYMKLLNFLNLRKTDIIKFPVADYDDLDTACIIKAKFPDDLAVFAVSPVLTTSKEDELAKAKLLSDRARKEGFTFSIQLHKLLGIY